MWLEMLQMRCFSNLKVHLNHPESFKMLPVSKYIMSTKDTENFPSLYRNFWSEVKSSQVTQSCPTLCDPVDYSPPGSSVHGILQARILEWVAISFSRGSSWPKDRTQVSHIAGRCFNLWATRKIRQNLNPFHFEKSIILSFICVSMQNI